MGDGSGTAGDGRKMSCGQLLERLDRAGVTEQHPEVEGPTADVSAIDDLVPVGFELRLERRPFVRFAGRDGAIEQTRALDGELAAYLSTHHAATIIDVPELLIAGDRGDGDRHESSLALAADALREIERDDLEIRRLEVLREALLAADLSSLRSTLRALLDALLDLTGAERGVIFLVGDGEPEARVHIDRSGEAEPPVLPKGVLTRAIEQRKVFTANDVTDDEELYQNTVRRLHIKSLLVAPLLKNDVVVAICYLDSRLSSTAFPESVVELFAGLAEDLFRLLDAAMQRESLETDLARLSRHESLGMFRGDGPKTAEVVAKLRRAAGTRQPIVLLGETGTGKTMLAEEVHQLSGQKRGAFVHVRVPELTESLFESEMFGHERGAFTGAVTGRRGLLQEADGGTLFLDEIGRLSATLQVKLLGALDGDSAGFRPVGGAPVRARFRLLAATSIDLEEAVRKGEFLADLWWRLAGGLVVTLPPLRERLDDLASIAEQLLRQAALAEELPPPRLASDALDALRGHDWPGNVRELRACLQRALWNATARESPARSVRAVDIDLGTRTYATSHDPYIHALQLAGYDFPGERNLQHELDSLRTWRIRKTLQESGYNESEAARRLGYRATSTFRSQLERLGIDHRRAGSRRADD